MKQNYSILIWDSLWNGVNGPKSRFFVQLTKFYNFLGVLVGPDLFKNILKNGNVHSKLLISYHNVPILIP